MLTISYLAIGIIFLYVLIVSVWKKKVPSSISETYYMGAKYWFTLVMCISAFMLVIGLLDYTNGSEYQFVSFLASAGLLFVGASPRFRDKSESVVHYTGASFILVGSQLWILLFASPWAYLIWVPLIWWIWTQYKTLMCELTCMLSFPLAILLDKWLN